MTSNDECPTPSVEGYSFRPEAASDVAWVEANEENPNRPRYAEAQK